MSWLQFQKAPAMMLNSLTMRIPPGSQPTFWTGCLRVSKQVPSSAMWSSIRADGIFRTAASISTRTPCKVWEWMLATTHTNWYECISLREYDRIQDKDRWDRSTDLIGWFWGTIWGLVHSSVLTDSRIGWWRFRARGGVIWAGPTIHHYKSTLLSWT